MTQENLKGQITTKNNKQVQIIERRVLRHLGLVVYRCKSSRGEEVYNTTLRNGKAERCTCTGWKHAGHCYHQDGCEAAEREKRETERCYYELQFIA